MSDQDTNTPQEAPVAPTAEAGKRQMSFTVLEDGTIRAEFGEGIEPLHLNPAAVPETLQVDAMTEGLISRARGYASKLVADARTPAALRDAIAKAFENLLAGVWKIERAAGEGGEVSMEVEAAFLFRQMRAAATNAKLREQNAPEVPFTGTLAEAAEAFGKLDEESKKELKALPRYQLALAEVKAKRQADKLAKMAAKLEKEGGDAGF